MKRRPTLGYLEGRNGARISITQPAVAERLDELQAALRQSHESRVRLSTELDDRTRRLMKLQNHWWTRLGEALRIVRP
ncbi:MAG: hypothetical protein ACT4PE_05480 [Candidatus Eiseniibacteriota bacterium]